MKQKSWICFFAAAALLLSGCEKKVERETISMMLEIYPSTIDADGGAWLNAIEAFTNTDFQIQTIPTLEYESDVEQKIRNDKLPMVLTANNSVLNSDTVRTYMKAGGFWELEPYLDDYPQLKEFVGDEIWERSKIQGHIYGIPRLRIQPRNVAFYRADWIDALGILPPETPDEIYSMLRAFTTEDPDGNKQNDTMGLADSWQNWGAREWNGIQTLTTALGGPNGWEYTDEKGMVPDFSTEAYFQALNWFRQLYQEGILEDSFAILTPVQRQEAWIQGRAGMIFGVIDDASELEDALKQFDPNARLGILPMIKSGELPPRINSTPGYNGLIVFNRFGKDAIKTEDELRRILSFYNQLCSQSGQELLVFGMEGTHFSITENGEKKYLYESGSNRSILLNEIGSYNQIFPIPDYTRTAEESPLQKQIYDEVEAREPYLIHNAATGLYSETDWQQGSSINKMIQKSSIRYILGEITEEDYWNSYEEWYQNGGKTIIGEYETAFLETIKQ